MPLRGILPSLRVPEDFQNSVLDQKSPQSGVPERRYNRRPAHQDHPSVRAVGQVHRAEGGRPQATARRHLTQQQAQAAGQVHRATEGRHQDRQGKVPRHRAAGGRLHDRQGKVRGQRSKEQEEPAGSTVRSVNFV